MTDKTEALRLAERLELRDYYEFDASLHCPKAASHLRSQAERIEVLAAEVEALRADAERYRAIREPGTGYLTLIALHAGDELDAAIDSARKE